METWYMRHSRAIILLAVLLLTASHTCWGQEGTSIGTVLVVEGSAEIQLRDTMVWNPLRFRDAVFVNDTVRTSAASKVKILIPDETLMTLAESSHMHLTASALTRQQRRKAVSLRSGTRLVLDEPPGENPPQQHTVVSLTSGTLRGLVGRLVETDSALEVRTPNAVAMAFGASFGVQFMAPDTTTVTCLEGIMMVRKQLSTLSELALVPQHSRTQVRGTVVPIGVDAVPVAELQQLDQALRVIEQIPGEVLPSTQVAPQDTLLLSSTTIIVPDVTLTVVGGIVAPPQAASEVGRTLQTEAITPDTSPAAPRINVRLLFPGR